jgi:hypothetical protein
MTSKKEDSMKEFEYAGIMFTVFAYTMIVLGYYSLGFWIGLCGNVALIFYFVDIKTIPSAWLQAFFVCANILGLIKINA